MSWLLIARTHWEIIASGGLHLKDLSPLVCSAVLLPTESRGVSVTLKSVQVIAVRPIVKFVYIRQIVFCHCVVVSLHGCLSVGCSWAFTLFMANNVVAMLSWGPRFQSRICVNFLCDRGPAIVSSESVLSFIKGVD